MRIVIDDVELDVWVDGFPKWFHIKQGDNMISFNNVQALAISSALKNLIECLKIKESENV